MNWHSQVESLLATESYAAIALSYEQAIEEEPDNISYYWYLGLAYLLQGREEEAQLTWLLVFSEGTPEETPAWTAELAEILATEAQRQETLENYTLSRLVRWHLREITPNDINNLLSLVLVSLKLEVLKAEEFENWQVVEQLSHASENIDSDLVIQTLLALIKFPHFAEQTIAFTKVSLFHIKDLDAFLALLIPELHSLGHVKQKWELAYKLVKLLINLDPNPHLELLLFLVTSCEITARFQEAVDTARRLSELSHTLSQQVIANAYLLRALTGDGGRWQEVKQAAKQHENLLQQLFQQEPNNLSPNLINQLLWAAWLFPYLRDDLPGNRFFQNQIAKLCQVNLQNQATSQIREYQNRKQSPSSGSKRLRIGYISHCLRQHSVGWLCRWLFQYHDRDAFHISAYLVNQPINTFTHHWFLDQTDASYNFKNYEANIVAEKIFADEIDILVDLDSISLTRISKVMAYKPAPVQVTWLGWDASGIPAVDYFIADPYVLPNYAEEHYSEKIFRLPQTYLAVEGFEVDPPTLRRSDLGIPEDAVVYLSSQIGRKRHPDTIRLQMKILKEVPNSYFLIKGPANEETVQKFFAQVAKEERVSPSRLRFLPLVRSELEHRANLTIADIVLDTYPYNGATTTLETLWMEIPIVTRVGKQFSARNSYTFMVNAGLSEGIAWTDEEYVEWGVRLGKDEALRQKVAWKLRQSRQTSPLWDAKQFTCEMENAYKQMWKRSRSSLK